MLFLVFINTSYLITNECWKKAEKEWVLVLSGKWANHQQRVRNSVGVSRLHSKHESAYTMLRYVHQLVTSIFNIAQVWPTVWVTVCIRRDSDPLLSLTWTPANFKLLYWKPRYIEDAPPNPVASTGCKIERNQSFEAIVSVSHWSCSSLFIMIMVWYWLDCRIWY